MEQPIFKTKSRIQKRNEDIILKSALTVFAEKGLHGARVEQIAELSDMSQPNLHNYFRTKTDLYIAVLEQTLETWLEPIDALENADDPKIALRRYVTRKLEMTRTNPDASRVFAQEMLAGAPYLRDQLQNTVVPRAKIFALQIDRWVAEGKIRAVPPYHLLFLIWAVTQHYADYAPQVLEVLGRKRLTKADFDDASSTILDTLLTGLILPG